MCGSEGRLLKAEIEGTVLNVCQNCRKYGKVVSTPRKPNFAQKGSFRKPRVQKEKEEEPMELVKSNYNDLIKKGREKLGLRQKELATKMAERESVIQKIESGHQKPSLVLAKKFERFLKVKLIETYQEEKKAYQSSKRALTIGDIIKIKKK